MADEERHAVLDVVVLRIRRRVELRHPRIDWL